MVMGTPSGRVPSRLLAPPSHTNHDPFNFNNPSSQTKEFANGLKRALLHILAEEALFFRALLSNRQTCFLRTAKKYPYQ
jgi:hypothetical protein